MADFEGFAVKAAPYAPLKIAYLTGCENMAQAIDGFIQRTRRRSGAHNPQLLDVPGYLPESFLIAPVIHRFGTGEGKISLDDSIRGSDLYILADVTNSSVPIKVFGHENHMSPDNHFQDIKRLISATNGTAHRINVIMPFLYESRQHKRTSRESLDCALALKELRNYGVSQIITFDAHDPSVQNAIPLRTFDNFMPTYQFFRALLRAVPDLIIDNDHLNVISPDEGAVSRTMYLANLLSVDVGVFYKRRDYSQVIGGKNPIVAHEYLGDPLSGKDAIIIDDMIASGGSMLDVCRQIKEKGANRIFICSTFGLFTEGLAAFDRAYEDGLFHTLITTNLVYQPPELLKRPYYETAGMHQYLANIVDTMNHDVSMDRIRGTTHKIASILERSK